MTLVGAGLPHLRARTGRAKSYAERLFDFPEVGPLTPEAARRAIEKPAQAEGVLRPSGPGTAPGARQPPAGRSSTAHALYDGCFEYGSNTASVRRLAAS